MTISVPLNTISNLQDTTTAQTNINANSAAITGGFSTALNVTGDKMAGNLDMNSNQILNLPAPGTMNSPIRLQDAISATSITYTVPPVGTSGSVVGFLNTNLTFSGNETFLGTNTYTATSFGVVINSNSKSLPAIETPTIFATGGPDNSSVFHVLSAFGTVASSHNATAHLIFNAARGTNSSPTAIGSSVDLTPTVVGSLGDYFTLIGGTGHDGSSYSPLAGSGIAFRPTQQWSSGSHGAGAMILVTPNGTTSPVYPFFFNPANGGTFVVNQNTGSPPVGQLPNTTMQSIGVNGSSVGREAYAYGGTVFDYVLTSGGTQTSKTAVSGSANIWSLGGLPYDGTQYNTVAAIDLQTFNTQNHGVDTSGYIRFRTTASGSTVLTEAVRIQPSGGLSIGTTTDPGLGTFITKSNTVTSLPAGVAGARGYVTDATATAFMSTVTGGGAIKVPVFYNGTNWVIA